MELLNCWPLAMSLIASGESGQAVELCENEVCSTLIECQRYLGWTYYRQGNMERALHWFSVAGDDAEALYGTGSIHFKQKSFKIAVECFEQAASVGFTRAYHWLGYMHLHGLGVSKNDGLAEKYYAQGAAHGYILAERALLHLALKRGNVFTRCSVWPRYIYVLAKAGVLAYRNINDERIADIPNPFGK